MTLRTVDVTLDNLSLAPPEVLGTVYWELDRDDCDDPRFHKEEWFSSTLLEWGPCGKLLVDEEPVGFAEFAPSTLFPRVDRFPSGPASPDAVYLSYLYLVPAARGQGLGVDLVRAVTRDLVDRGYRALEAIGDREWAGGWVLPATFLDSAGFEVVRDDPRYPLMRLDLTARREPAREMALAADLPEGWPV
ncbi:MAG TPA: GNAT family N-acetyltransferase [Actinomycetota bacterium]|jgi:GNAT superfamily N-acetyltransferase